MKTVKKIIILFYLFLILTIFPLYFQDKYWDMAFYKWIFFLFTTLLFIVVLAAASLLQGAGRFVKKTGASGKMRFRTPDYLILAYGISNIITFMTCSSRQAAWMGTDGWYMGLLAQLLLVIVYLMLSMNEVSEKWFLLFQLAGSAACFGIAVCQRFGWDFLHLYWEMPAEVIRDYVSTLGNRSWFSGYVSAVFPLGIYLFWNAKKRKITIFTGMYVLLSFCCIVTMNTNSIYLGLVVVLYAVGLMSVGNSQRLFRWLMLLDLLAVACVSMSLMRMAFPIWMWEPRGMTKLLLNPVFGLVLLACLLAITGSLGYCMVRFPDKLRQLEEKYNAGKLRKNLLLVTIATVLGACLFIILNTTGMLQKWFGVTIQNSYLYFNDLWGDSRGFNWGFSVRMYGDLPLKEKIFGVGQDCFAYYAYQIPEYVKELKAYWGDLVLMNAHNEWLNSLICNGLLGGCLYLLSFSVVVREYFTAKACLGDSSLVPGVGLCVLSYMANNFFGYQQISAVAVIFVSMGVAMSVSKKTV